MNLPNFFCLGAQKAGTTLLFKLMKEIDGIYLPSVKEAHFFDRMDKYEKGLNWYGNTFFQNADNYSVIGEITASYLFLDEVPKRIYDSLGSKLKFIVILRNPIERAYSHYAMRYRNDEEGFSFNDALILESARINVNLENKMKYSYLQRGLYSKQITNYLKYFDQSQFMFILFENFIQEQDIYLEKICKFLDVKKKIVVQNQKVHSSKLSFQEKIRFSVLNKNYDLYSLLVSEGYPAMDNKTKEILIEYYLEDINSLEKIINKDLSKWLQ